MASLGSVSSCLQGAGHGVQKCWECLVQPEAHRFNPCGKDSGRSHKKAEINHIHHKYSQRKKLTPPFLVFWAIVWNTGLKYSLFFVFLSPPSPPCLFHTHTLSSPQWHLEKTTALKSQQTQQTQHQQLISLLFSSSSDSNEKIWLVSTTVREHISWVLLDPTERWRRAADHWKGPRGLEEKLQTQEEYQQGELWWC